MRRTANLLVAFILAWFSKVVTAGKHSREPLFLPPAGGHLSMPDYVQNCVDYLLSDPVIEDELISQVEYTDFLESFCVKNGHDSELIFRGLSVPLQLAFVTGVCDDRDERKDCVDELLDNDEDEFGFDVTQDIDKDILNLCELSYEFAVLMCPPPPTTSPSLGGVPTLAPAAIPTSIPGGPTLDPATASSTPVAPTIGDAPTSIPGGPTLDPATAPSTPVAPTFPSSVPTPVQGGTPAPTSGNTPDIPSVSPSTPTEAVGANSPRGAEPLSGGDDDGLGGGAIAGIAAAGVGLILVLFLFAKRRRHSERQDKGILGYEIQGDGSIMSEAIMSEDSRIVKILPLDYVADTQSLDGDRSIGGSSGGQGGGKDSGSETSSQVFAAHDRPGVRSIAQFDTAAAIALNRNSTEDDDTNSSQRSSRKHHGALPGSASLKSDTLSRLEQAIDMGDWDVVANLASKLSDSDDLSTLSGVSGNAPKKPPSESLASSDRDSFKSARSTLSPEDQERAQVMDEMLGRRDYQALASFATALSSEKGSAEDPNRLPVGGTGSYDEEHLADRGSFIDFVTGRRSSTAAAAAVGAAATRQQDRSQTFRSVSGEEAMPPFLSGGNNTIETESSSSNENDPQAQRMGTDPSQGTAVQGAAVAGAAVAGVAGATAVAATRRKSSKKRSFLGLFSRQSKSQNQAREMEAPSTEDAERSHSLRSELDVAAAHCDWEAVERISAQIMSTKDQRDRDDHGQSPIGSPQVTSKKDSSAPNLRSFSTDSDDRDIIGLVSRSAMSAKARGSSWDSATNLRVQLDEAIERGDWLLLEKLSKEMAASKTSATLSASNTKELSQESQFVPGASVRKVGKTVDGGDWAALAHNSKLQVQLDEAINRGDWLLVAELSKQMASSNAAATPSSNTQVLTQERQLPPGASIPMSPSPSLQTRLDEAINRGDWLLVAELSKQMASSNTAATPSSDTKVLSQESQLAPGASIPMTPTPSLQMQLDEAIERGDWLLVAELSKQMASTTSTSDTKGVSPETQLPARASIRAIDGGDWATPTKTKENSEEPQHLSRASIRAIDGGDWVIPTKPKGSSPEPQLPTRASIRAIDGGDWVVPTKPKGLSQEPQRPTRASIRAIDGGDGEFSPTTKTIPSSAEASRPASSPVLSREQEAQVSKIETLARQGDWKGVNVLAGLYNMEEKGMLPPSSQVSTVESAQREKQRQSASDSKPAGQKGFTPSSSSTSLVSKQTLEEFERLVSAKDWKGLASFARNEDENVTEEQVSPPTERRDS